MSQYLPSTNIIPALLTDASIYKDGVGLLGIGNIEMPDFEMMSESISGLGIAGEVDAPVVGHLKSMQLKITWNTCNETATGLLVPVAHQLEVYASVQNYDAGSGTYVHQPVKAVVKAAPKKVGMGKMEPGKKMDSETELEVYYIKLWQNGKEMIEADKFNYIFRVLGVDYLATVRANLGKDY